MDLFECSICRRKYDDVIRRPRTLKCAHYFCEQCIDRTIKSVTPHCPTCRSPISAKSACKLPPNFLMEELLRKMKIQREFPCSGRSSPISGRSSPVSGRASPILNDYDEDVSAGFCPKHKNGQLYFCCITHNMRICRDCTVLNHPPSKCKVITFNEELEDRKAKYIEKLTYCTTGIKKDIEHLKKHVDRKNRIINKQELEVNRLQKHIKKEKQLRNNANHEVEACYKQQRLLDLSRTKLSSVSSSKEITQLCQEIEKMLSELKNWQHNLKNQYDFNSTPVSNNRKVSRTTKSLPEKLLYDNAVVYVVADNQSLQRSSMFVVRDNEIYLPALSKSLQPPKEATVMPLSTALSQFPKANSKVFMILATENSILGTVYIRLRDNPSANMFKELCMGTPGTSYRGIKFGNKFRNYFSCDNLKYFSPSNKPAESEPRQRGMVNLNDATGFGFTLTNSSEKRCIVGDVVTGMDVVDIAYSYPMYSVLVKDVGVVLHQVVQRRTTL